jgi:hypothetical protein
MVRHTHRRRQSRGRRRNTRRSSRTQRGGGGILSFFGIGSKDLAELQKKLMEEQDPIKKAEIQEEISIEQAKQIKDRTVKQIKESVSNGAASQSSTGVNNNMTRNSAGQFQSPANGTGVGVSNMFGAGRRRRSHRRR